MRHYFTILFFINIFCIKAFNNHQVLKHKFNFKLASYNSNDNNFYTLIENSTVKLEDIAGLEYAKEEFVDIIDFLKNTQKYTNMGARLPRGILLYGPPGTAKTLLAKSIAGEAQIPFYATSGSSFVNIYVGTGSANIRALFAKAKAKSPSIIFIDEIDAIGGARTNSVSKNEERESALNQLLVEMDGFTTKDNVIVIASTNRLDILDEALIRSGRFDKKIYTSNPDVSARYEIIKIHSRNKKIADSVNFHSFAKLFVGLNGADIETIMNEAALIACRNNLTEISSDLIQQSYYKIAFGYKLYDIKIPSYIVKVISIRQSSRALICNHFALDTVIYLSIIPNNKNKEGITLMTANSDFADINLYTKAYLFSKIAVLLAARAGEELIFGDCTVTNDNKDINEALKLISEIILQFPVNNEFIPQNIEDKKKVIFNFIFKKTKQILISKKTKLLDLNSKLLTKKEIYEDEFQDIMNNIDTTGNSLDIADTDITL